MIAHLKYHHHSENILQALEIRTELNIEISGSDNVRTDSSSLWLFSPLVRSVLASLREVQGNTLILPDFSSEDVRTALDMLGGGQRGLLVFNSTTKSLLETLGVNLNKTELYGVQIKSTFVKIEDLEKEDRENDIDDIQDHYFIFFNMCVWCIYCHLMLCHTMLLMVITMMQP